MQLLILGLMFAAHEDSIWSCAWGKSEKDGTENIVTGSIDDLVKVYKWQGQILSYTRVEN